MRKFTFSKYEVPLYIKEAMEVLRPPEDITVSQWAEKYRILSDKTNYLSGAWRNSVTPYLIGIMDEFNNYTTEKIVFVKPTQVGGTEAILNILGYCIDQDPGPCMIVYPTDKLAESTSEKRLQPMLQLAPTLAAKFDKRNTSKDEIKLETMDISLANANSPSGLASKPIRYLFLDETDKYPGASKKEADPISLAEERTKTFANRKIYMCSTPTLRTGHIWKEKEACDIEKHYFVPCPHCKEYIELRFAQIRWPGGDTGMSNAERAEFANYVCQECGSIITDQQKGRMLIDGRWEIVRGDKSRARSVAFWMNTLYSPFTRFSEIALEFMKSKEDPDSLHNFTNSWLAEPWEDTRLKTNADMVLERQTELPEFVVPQWAKMLTAGVDVQETSLYWTIRAWGDFLTSQNIAHGQVLSLTNIVQIMNSEYLREDGQPVLVALCLVDAGDQTDDIYDFCAVNSEWALPCFGRTDMLSHYKISVVNRTASMAHGMQLVLADSGKYKDMIASRMRKPNGEGSWMVYQGCDREYAEQVTAEHKVSERTAGGREIMRWVPKTSHADNHYLDCEVYAMAAADVLGVRNLFLQEEHTEPAPQPAEVPPEESWLGNNGGWI